MGQPLGNRLMPTRLASREQGEPTFGAPIGKKGQLVRLSWRNQGFEAGDDVEEFLVDAALAEAVESAAEVIQ